MRGGGPTCRQFPDERASWPGSLSLQPFSRSFETQHAELQYTLLRPVNSKAQTVRLLGCGRSPWRGAEGALGLAIVTVVHAAPSNCMLPGPDDSDSPNGTLHHLRRQSEQVRCHTPWPAMTVFLNKSSGLQLVCRHGDATAFDSVSDSPATRASSATRDRRRGAGVWKRYVPPYPPAGRPLWPWLWWAGFCLYSSLWNS